MEGTLQQYPTPAKMGKNFWSFNPYFSGRYSATVYQKDRQCIIIGFNPYFSGRYSATMEVKQMPECDGVSILILVEGTLQP